MSKSQRVDPLAPEQMQQFVASIAALPPQEMRQAKLLYIRNAIAELRAQEKIFAAFGNVQGCLGFIPIFWPIIAMQKKMMDARKDLSRQRIVNALEVWKDDLLAVGFDVSRFKLNDNGNDDGDRFGFGGNDG